MTGRHRLRRPPRHDLRRTAGAAGAVVVAASAIALSRLAVDDVVAGSAVPVAATRLDPSWATGPAEQDAATAAAPVRLRIPVIGVDSPIVDVGVDETGALVPPGTPEDTGWFTGGPAPGAVGPALLAGHIDSHDGPAVFFRLADLKPGDEISVDREDGSTVAFVVESSIRVAKTAFPTDLVYAPLPTPVLRLVTCGGKLDTAAHSYLDNVIVEAVPR
ncbi:class F sortase [Umezawaea tangerina]|uniref:Sortase family protein n=1 Tax=Umezawaea tangerina TaxID=84725 RepID=A0A2T0SZD9_9PSEU|nr:class F sortase [Umezawaea tangerina]PRY38769.1 sortase family protein [Umezawaea tangerina]